MLKFNNVYKPKRTDIFITSEKSSLLEVRDIQRQCIENANRLANFPSSFTEYFFKYTATKSILYSLTQQYQYKISKFLTC